MMAPVVRHRRRNASSASGRHSDRFDTIDGLESLGSGPLLLPVEPAACSTRREEAVRYLGMDVHGKLTVWCLVDERGEVGAWA
jgi:hypothetical protein